MFVRFCLFFLIRYKLRIFNAKIPLRSVIWKTYIEIQTYKLPVGGGVDCAPSVAMNTVTAINPQWRKERITGATVYYSTDPTTKLNKVERVVFDSLRGYRQCRAEFEGRSRCFARAAGMAR